MGAHNGRRDGEAQPVAAGPGVPRLIGPVEAVEEMRHILPGDGLHRVEHPQLDRVFLLFQEELDPPPPRPNISRRCPAGW